VLPEPAARRARLERNRRSRRRGAAHDASPLPGITVRVIMFTLTITSARGSRRSEPYRLITTLLSPAEAPAARVAECYAQRWEAETSYRELKVSLRGPGRILRSQDPAMVRQEIWAMLCACQLIHAHRAAAAAAAEPALDPDRISFTITLRAIRRHLTTGPGRGRHPTLTSELLSQLLPARRPRSFPRLPLNPTASRRQARAGHNTAITCTITINPASTGPPGP
jgi:DDE family transposase